MAYFFRWKNFLVWLVVAAGFVVALPNVLSHRILACLPQWYAGLHLPVGLDLRGGTRLVLQLPKNKTELSGQVIAVVRQRLRQSGYVPDGCTVARSGSRHVRIEAPGFFDVQRLKDLVSMTAGFSLYEAAAGPVTAGDVITGRAHLPAGTQLVYSFDDPPVGYLVAVKALAGSENILHAGAAVGDGPGQARLQLALDDAAAARLNDFIALNSKKSLVAVVDGEVLQTLRLAAPLQHGRLDIGPLDETAARDLATVMNSGPLPVDVSLVEERTVGADLGGHYARSGLQATLAALLVVALFMIASYGVWGLAADIALAAHIALLLAVLSLAGISLTLAGFAGLVLTAGVCVDANILIYERIREDYRNGYPLARALQSGFSRAAVTIIDANATIFMAALVLFLLGVGPVHGFALTVTIGIVICLFTTFTVTRALLHSRLCRDRLPVCSAFCRRLIGAGPQIGFMRLRRFTLAFAAVLSLSGLALYAGAGMRYGLDFAGGSVAVLKARNGPADIMDIFARANELNIDSVTVRQGKDPAEAVLAIGYQGTGEDGEQTVAARLRGEFGGDYLLERMDVVGPAVSGALGRSVLGAVLLSLAAIFIYVRLRFCRRFAVGAVVTTLHDLVVLLGLFVFFQWEFSLWSAAAVLAIIGYSLNDTIVVYDRIRDLVKQNRAIPMPALVDMAINRTLSRTMLTSCAMFLAHVPLYYFGGADMRNFASVLLIGILIGTYSSIFIAGPLLVWLGVGKERHGSV